MKIKRADFIAILFLFAAGVALSFVIFLPHTETGQAVEVRIDGVVKNTLPLSVDRTETITGSAGSNQLEIRDGVVYMTDADCHDKVCVRMHGISRSGQTIVCLPHKLVLAIVSPDSKVPELDAVTGQ